MSSAALDADSFFNHILIALGTFPTPDQNLKAKAVEFCEFLRDSADGWKYCLNYLSYTEFKTSEQVAARFWILEVLTHSVRSRFNQFSIEERDLVKNGVWEFILNVYSKHEQPIYMRNKVASLIVAFIDASYPEYWPSIFSDLTQLLNQGFPFIDLYLRVFKALDEDIISQNASIPREPTHIMRIKDAMRESCILDIVRTWYEIAVAFESQPAVVEGCLDCLQRYTAWIDIELVVNDKVIPLIYKYLCVENDGSLNTVKLRAADCMFEIVYKKMPGSKKVGIISSIGLMEVLSQFTVPKEYDEFTEYIAALVCTIGTSMLEYAEEKTDASGECFTILMRSLTLSLHYFKIADYKVSTELIPFFHESISFIQKQGTNIFGSSFCTSLVMGLCEASYTKLPFPEDFNHTDPDDEEISFLHFRKAVDNLLQYILQNFQDLFVEFIGQVSSQIVLSLSQVKPTILEAALHIFYLVVTASRFCSLGWDHPVLLTIFESYVRSNIGHVNDPSVILQYLDLIPKFSSALRKDELLVIVMNDLCGSQGLISDNKMLRMKSAFTLLRLIREFPIEHRCKFQPFVEHLLNLIQYSIFNCLDFWSSEGISDDSTKQSLFSEDDIYFLCEALGILCSEITVGKENSSRLIRVVLTTFYERMEQTISMDLTGLRVDKFLRGKLVAIIITAMGNLSKSFVRDVQEEITETTTLFANLLQNILSIFTDDCRFPDLGPHHKEFRNSVIFYLHRMVHAIKQVMLPYLGDISKVLLNSTTPENFIGTLNIISQFVVVFRDGFYESLNGIFGTLASKYHEHLKCFYATDGLRGEPALSELFSESLNYRRVFCTFCCTLFKKNCGEILISDVNISHLPNVLGLLMECYTSFGNDLSLFKGSFFVFYSILSSLASKGMLIDFSQQVFGDITQSSIHYLFTKLDRNDALSNSAMLDIIKYHSISLLLWGDQFVYILADLLARCGVSTEVIQVYIANLRKGSKPEDVKKYLKANNIPPAKVK